MGVLYFLGALFFSASALEFPPRFTLDLRKPPLQRWDGALDSILSKHPYAESFLPVFQEHNSTLFNYLQPSHFESLARAVTEHYPETALELQGIAADFERHGHAVTFQYLSAWLYFHELAHTDVGAGVNPRECTGIVAKTEKGELVQLANMDQTPLAARNLTLRIHVVGKNGVQIFEGVDWYTLLTTGVSRGMRRGVASVQENWRSQTRKLEDVMTDIQSGVISQMLVFRRAFESPEIQSFDAFLHNVSNTRLAAPFYIVAAGPEPRQAVAIARNLYGSDGTDWLQKGDFFLCQCNTDRWLPDDVEDPRRTAAETLLRRMKEEDGLSMTGLFAVVSSYPVHNPHTAYTAVMFPVTGQFHVYVREASCPVDPYASVVLDRRYCLKDPKEMVVNV